MVRDRIKLIKQRLEKVRKQRDQGRRGRQRSEIPTVSLVGYTNVGKSTIMNMLSKSDVFAENKLFATLDTTVRKVVIGNLPFLMADTVGFISHLPHRLVDAFRATLEEAVSADLLLHVIDAAAEDRATNVVRVDEVLKEIEADRIPSLMVYNKGDLLDDFSPRIDRDSDGMPIAVWVSALAGEGMDLLLQAIAERLPSKIVHKHLQLQQSQGSFRAALYRHKAVLNESVSEKGAINLEIQLSENDFFRILKAEGLKTHDLVTL